ncbi:MAG: hypothetical protein KGL39_13675 [Patescibacteria group bacterium]|nr:hypothetical protein [Patescibacteria group bacterium]
MLDVLLPALRYQAHACGYALAVHGSVARDIDLIAVPWRESAVPADSLLEGLFKIVDAVLGVATVEEPDFGNCGRRRQVIYLTEKKGGGPYLDMSVMPRSASDYPTT